MASNELTRKQAEQRSAHISNVQYTIKLMLEKAETDYNCETALSFDYTPGDMEELMVDFITKEVTSLSINGKVISDTLEYEMAYPNGDWMGQGFGDVYESKLWYKENVRFPETGTYQFKIRQAMRKNGNVNGISELQGITDVGFRIEKP